MELINHLRYSLYVILRPFDGFWDLKHEKRGSLAAANLILIMAVLTRMIHRQLTGFLFNFNHIESFNAFTELVVVLVPFILWCVSNWCITTLIDGKATFKDIVTVSGYALTPFIVINIPLVILSNVMVLEEEAFYVLFSVVAVIWFIFLLLAGIMTVQQFTFSKTIFTSILTIIGMAIMVFLALLFFSLIQQIYQFVLSIYNEIILRL